MKNIYKIIIISFIILYTDTLLAQISPYTEISPSELFIVNSVGSKYMFLGSKNELITKFGSPNQIKNITSADMLDYEDIEDYIYNGLTITIENRPSNSSGIFFEITNSNFYIKYLEEDIKIGGSIDDIQFTFLESFEFMEEKGEKYLRLEFDSDDILITPYYCQLIINFNQNSRIITSIEVIML